MKRFLWVWCAALIVFGMGIGVTAAQDDEIIEVETDDGTYQVTLLPGWTVDDSGSEGEIIMFSPDGMMISVTSLSSLMTEANINLFSDEDFRESFFDEVAGEAIEGLDFEFRDDRIAGFRFFEEDNSAAVLVLLELEPGTYAMVTGFHSVNEPEELFDAMNKVVSTVQIAGTEAATEEPTAEATTRPSGMRGGSLGGGSSSTVSANTVDSCEVDADDGIALHVGPGSNRATFGYLQNAGTFTAIAQSEAGGVWYQLDKEDAAPNATAAEIWVSADDVDAEAACDDLEMVEASAPVVRTTGGGSTGGNTGGNSGGSTGSNTNNGGGNNNPPAGGSGNPIPSSGTWTLSLAATTNASCEGTENVAFPTTDLFSQLSFTGGLSASRDGSTLIIDGDAFVLQGETTYVGSFSIPEGNMQMYLVIQSPSLITGQAVYNFVIDGRPCSATIGLSITRG
jgi:hypothetical protein